MAESKQRREYGSGSISQRADGTWTARMVIGVNEKGRPRIKALYGKEDNTDLNQSKHKQDEFGELKLFLCFSHNSSLLRAAHYRLPFFFSCCSHGNEQVSHSFKSHGSSGIGCVFAQTTHKTRQTAIINTAIFRIAII